MRQSTEGTCKVEGCTAPIRASGWCNAHYIAARKHNGDPLGRHISPQCSVEGCDKTSESQGLCNKHYKRLRRHGAPDYKRPPKPTAPGLLSAEAIAAIKASTEPAEVTAARLATTVRTVVAIRKGRNWGWLADSRRTTRIRRGPPA